MSNGPLLFSPLLLTKRLTLYSRGGQYQSRGGQNYNNIPGGKVSYNVKGGDGVGGGGSSRTVFSTLSWFGGWLRAKHFCLNFLMHWVICIGGQKVTGRYL